ncbi:MAG: hypothetical protein K5682_00020 [Lachnospiraceae bacterium]|nr:hypothetical protein [Lachnospiraceae bacterium]
MKTVREVYNRVYQLPECGKKGGYFSLSLPAVKEKNGKTCIFFAVHQHTPEVINGFVVYSPAEDHAVYLSNQQVQDDFGIALIDTLTKPAQDQTPAVEDPEFMALDLFEKAVLSDGFVPELYVEYLRKVMAQSAPAERAVYQLFL